MIETRRAADLLGATKMDRPEDIQPNGSNGKVYVMLTNNTRRTAEQIDAANPRAENAFGHIIEIGRGRRRLRGDDAAHGKSCSSAAIPRSPKSARPSRPHTTVERLVRHARQLRRSTAMGRLWVSTDGNNPTATGRTDGLWAVDTEGEARATSKLFFRVPVGAEMCGPLFTPDDETAFVAVQHPADGGQDWEPFGRPSYYEDLSTRWPDFDDAMPVRPSVVVDHQAGRRQDRGLAAGPIDSREHRLHRVRRQAWQ